MAEDGLRVLAIARADLDVVPADLAEAAHGMVLVGLVGMIDPPRAGGRRCRRRVPHGGDRAGDDHR